MKWNSSMHIQHKSQITMLRAHLTSQMYRFTVLHFRFPIFLWKTYKYEWYVNILPTFFHSSRISYKLSQYSVLIFNLWTCDGGDYPTNEIMNTTTSKAVTFHFILDLFWLNESKLLQVLRLWPLLSQHSHFTVCFPLENDLFLFSGLLKLLFWLGARIIMSSTSQSTDHSFGFPTRYTVYWYVFMYVSHG